MDTPLHKFVEKYSTLCGVRIGAGGCRLFGAHTYIGLAMIPITLYYLWLLSPILQMIPDLFYLVLILR